MNHIIGNNLGHALQNTQEEIKTLARNAADPSTADLRVRWTAGSGGIPKIETFSSEDLSKAEQSLSAASRAGYTAIKKSFFLKINDALGDLHGGVSVGEEGFENANSINHMFTAMLGALESDDALPEAKQKAVSAIQDFTNSIASYQKQLDKISMDVESGISDTINNINAHLKEIYKNNTRISFNGVESDAVIKSQSVNQLRALAESVDVTSFETKGRITTRGSLGISTMNWVDERGYYAQLAYNRARPNEIQISLIEGATGEVKNILPVEIRDSDGNPLSGIGGALQGLLEFRDKELVTAKRNVADTMENIAYALNKMHNEGCGFPPSSLVSEKQVFGIDKLHASGNLKIASFSADGQPLGNHTLPVNVDLGETKTMSELVDLINKRAKIPTLKGALLGDNVDSQAGKFLIRDVVGNITNIDSSGKGSFNLNMTSGTDFNSQIRIKSLEIRDDNTGGGNAGTVIGDLSKSFQTLEAGETLETLAIPFTIPTTGNQREFHAFVEIEVVGQDGTFSRERIHCAFDSGSNNGLVNMNAPKDYLAPAAPAGWPASFNNATDANIPGVAAVNVPQVTASLTPNNELSLAGRVGFVTDVDAPAKVINEKGEAVPFALHFGLNNLFSKDAASGRWNVSQRIADNPEFLSWNKIKKMSTEVQDTLEGTANASGWLNLNAGNVLDNETVTINGETFIFKTIGGATYDATNPNHVLVGGNEAATIQELKNRIEAFSPASITGLMDLTIDADPRKLNFTAKFQGQKGNSITLAENCAGAISGANFAGGVDAARRTDRVATHHRYVLTKNGDAFALDKAVILPNKGGAFTVKNIFDSGFLFKASDAIQSADRSDQVAKSRSEAETKIYQDFRKDSTMERSQKLIEVVHNANVLASIRALINRHRENNLQNFR